MGNMVNLLVFVISSLVVFSVIVTCGCVNPAGECPDDIADRNAALSELMAFQGDVSTDLKALGSITEDCGRKVAEDGGDERSVTEFFDKIVAENPAVYTVVYIDSSGTVKINNSGAGGNISGMNLLSQSSVREQTEIKVPMLTDSFILHDKTHASALYYPVFDSEGRYRGFVSLSFLPSELVRESAENLNLRTGFSAMAAQPGGLILYDPDPEEVGKETFGNPEYEDFPEILIFARLYSEEWSGSYEYSFYDTGFDKKIRKEAFWTTVDMWDNNWRVFVIRDL
ncbi:hypothetical protein [Methanoplanus endosymbiosus]|uniref:Dret-0059-like sensor domain-containing protein n=1 Tax=Methanoplanus endosymbiosus TaxID=33865 RepID=A0A9E7PPS2_9EURY|nr:hypothetical protein [Methanoplanus endosymbiosus]UUX93790.1 hypothetical protein L6E24_06665 [Methanoplanus endosymbiosus]